MTRDAWNRRPPASTIGAATALSLASSVDVWVAKVIVMVQRCNAQPTATSAERTIPVDRVDDAPTDPRRSGTTVECPGLRLRLLGLLNGEVGRARRSLRRRCRTRP